MARGYGRWRLSAPSIGLLALGACGGGGGGGLVSTPTPVAATPAPTPTPTPTPTPAATPAAVTNDTAEYRATVGAVSMNALAGYSVGATGAGINVGIVDSGIDTDSAEFAGRISTASQDVAGSRGVDDEDGHGTAVAFTLAGRRDGTGTQGVAFAATLVVERADRPGTCATRTDVTAESTCSFGSDAIAKGVDGARAAGARVINISLGGTEMPAALSAAIGRATAAGIVVVIAAGNDGSDNPDAFTAIANDAATARNQVIVAGSVGSTDGISTFSDRAGTEAAHYLTAVGEQVRAPDAKGTTYLWSGTSFAAPQISGAVALLAQAFPNLTGAQIVDILFKSARDAGAPGVDAVYGQGVLDLTRAFQPLGGTSVAGSTTAVSTTANATLSTPMGDATSAGSRAGVGAVILDGYGRAFAIDLARTIAAASPSPLLAPALVGTSRNVAMARGGMTATVTLAPVAGDAGRGAWAMQRTDLSPRDAAAARAVAATVTQRLGGTLTLGFAMAQGSAALQAQLAGGSSSAFLIARDDAVGFDTRAGSAAAVRQALGSLGVTMMIEHGDVLSRRDEALPRPGWRRSGFDRATLALDRRFGPIAADIAAGRLDEAGTVLGARFDPALGGGGATTWQTDARARLDAGDGWSLGGRVRQGWTRAAGHPGDTLRTGAFAADIGKRGLFGDDSAGLGVAQPLRVTSGALRYTLPTLWDYATGSIATWTTQALDLAPTGHELDVEAHYARPGLGGAMQANLFWRRDPGNIAGLPVDYGVALRYAAGF